MSRFLSFLALCTLPGCIAAIDRTEVSSCVNFSAESDNVTLKYGPKEWTNIPPSGYYSAECSNCSHNLFVIPVIVHRHEGTQQTAYTILKITQEDMLYVTHTTVTNALFYHRGILEADETEGEHTEKVYGVLRMGKEHPLVLIDQDTYYYNRFELQPKPAPNLLHSIFRKNGKRNTAFDGLCVIKCHVNIETERLHNVVLIEQASPYATPIISLYQNLQLRGDALCDGGGNRLFSVQQSKHATTLTDKQGRSYTAMGEHFAHEPIPSPI